MIDPSRSVAIVGRPNVGKSRLFNRLIGKRLAIVHDQPGVTRDVVMEDVDDNFILMDTGGIGMKPTEMSSAEINKATEEQVDFAIEAASVILFVVDMQVGLTPEDQTIAAKLRKYGKPVLLVINKLDSQKHVHLINDFYRLGFKDTLTVSAEHGLHADVLLEKIKELLGPEPEVDESETADQKLRRRIRICFTGRPNVGKSSLTNRLLKSDRLIVSDVPGTTRDSVEVNLDYEAPDNTSWHFQLIDTAGLKPRAKVKTSLDYFSGLRTGESIEGADVVFLILDALTGVTKLDKKIAGDAIELGRGLVIIVNKWDFAMKQFADEPVEGYESETDFRKAFVKAVRKELFFIPQSPIIFTSATQGYGIDEILRRGKAVFDRMHKKLPTGRVNRLIAELMEKQKPHIVHGKRFKIYYAVQIGNNPFRIRIYCNQEMRLEDSYKRYLEAGFNEAFQLDGCPVKFDLVGKKPSDRR